MNLVRIAKHIANLDYNYFHLSRIDHGDEFTFKPSIPDDAFEDFGYEDFTTERISLAPTVEGALLSLPISGNYFIYGTKSTDIYIPKPLPEIPEENMNEDFWTWYDYAEWKGLDVDDKNLHAEVVQGKIPDPETGEVWSLKPITMQKIGEVDEFENITWY
jgi:hypothetical protein